MKEWLRTVPQHLKRQPLTFNVMKLVPGEMHLFITQWTGMKRFRLRIQNTLRMVHAPGANKRFVHVELCETADYVKFKRSYEKYVRLLARILKDNNLSVEKDCGHIMMWESTWAVQIMKTRLNICRAMAYQNRSLEVMYNGHIITLVWMFLFRLNRKKYQQQ